MQLILLFISLREVGARAEEVVVEEAGVARLGSSPGQVKRQCPGNANQSPPKRARISVPLERTNREQREDLASVLQYLDEEFAEKERLSHEQEWCAPIPHDRKISTVQEFYKEFHDASMLPTHT